MHSIPLPAPSADPIDWELLFCSHVLSLPSLHWGVWVPEDPFSLEGLRRAQDRYSERVVAMLPENARSVLDVGCGSGDIARRIAATGRSVTAIAPIANYEAHLSALEPEGISFRKTRFQEFESDQPFDAVMMIESAGYFPIDVGLKRAKDLVKPGGTVLVVNPFRRTPVSFQVARHVLDDYLAEAQNQGFTLESSTDVTDESLRTLEFYRGFVDNHLQPAFDLLTLAAARSRPIRMGLRVATMLFRGRISKFKDKLAWYQEQLNPELVGQHARYMMLRFAAPG